MYLAHFGRCQIETPRRFLKTSGRFGLNAAAFLKNAEVSWENAEWIGKKTFFAVEIKFSSGKFDKYWQNPYLCQVIVHEELKIKIVINL